MISTWQDANHFHPPINYTMHSLNYLFGNDRFPRREPLLSSTADDFIKVEEIMQRIKNKMSSIRELLESISTNKINHSLTVEKKNFDQKLSNVSETFQRYRQHLQEMLINSRRHGSAMSADDILAIQMNKFPTLGESEMNSFYANVQQWSEKVKFIEELKMNGIQYFDGKDLPCQSNDPRARDKIDQKLDDHCLKNDGKVILWYSSNQLRKENAEEWKRQYESFRKNPPPFKKMFYSLC